jgi:hypothetical protein
MLMCTLSCYVLSCNNLLTPTHTPSYKAITPSRSLKSTADERNDRVTIECARMRYRLPRAVYVRNSLFQLRNFSRSRNLSPFITELVAHAETPIGVTPTFLYVRSKQPTEKIVFVVNRRLSLECCECRGTAVYRAVGRALTRCFLRAARCSALMLRCMRLRFCLLFELAIVVSPHCWWVKTHNINSGIQPCRRNVCLFARDSRKAGRHPPTSGAYTTSRPGWDLLKTPRPYNPLRRNQDSHKT